MSKKDDEIQKLRMENNALHCENAILREKIDLLQAEVAKWEHCHRQDMADNVRLKNQVSMLIGSDHLLEVPK